MNLSRSILGGLVGILAVVLWQAFGATTFFVALGIGALGFGVGWVLEHPSGIIELLRRLER